MRGAEYKAAFLAATPGKLLGVSQMTRVSSSIEFLQYKCATQGTMSRITVAGFIK